MHNDLSVKADNFQIFHSAVAGILVVSNTMRAFLVFLAFAAFTLWFRWYFVCQVKHLCEDTPAAATRPTTLAFRDGDSIVLSGYEEFDFELNSIAPVLTPNNNEFLDKVASYLKENPGKSLTITGLYRPSEKDKSSGIFENLGVARAAAIRQMLITRGVDESRMSLDYAQSLTDDLQEPLAFMADTSGLPASYEKTQFSFDNMTFSDANFEYNSDAFRPSEQFVLYADSVKRYLGLNPAKMLTLIGHTDSIASHIYNDSLGMRRARSAREYFRELGVTADIKVDSKGKRNPAAANATEEGRQKNRRINVRID